MKTESLHQRVSAIKKQFQTTFSSAAELLVRAPGRVNLIGEHTDYNEGFVLPAAIDREMLIAASTRTDMEVHVFSDEYKVLDRFSLRALSRSREHSWSDYLRGTLSVLQDCGNQLQGFNAVLSGNVPQGAGLSSSAAYEVAVVTLANEMNHLDINGIDVALLAQKAENDFIGVKCGIMDQFISTLAKEDSALFIDCRSLSYQAVPLRLAEQNVSIVITNSGVSRGLVDSEYNARRNECIEGTKMLSRLLDRRLSSLRDITWTDFEKQQTALPPVVAQRCRHVVAENARVQMAVSALSLGKLDQFGKLMNESHASLRDDFQVSCLELDELVALTQQHPGVIGARMTGAGFGGCTVALMQSEAVESYCASVVPEYNTRTNRTAQVWVCQAVDGAQVLIFPCSQPS